MAEKSADKSAGGARGKPFAKGGKDPRQGRGPKPGAPNAGRPPNWFKLEMERIGTRPEVFARLRRLTSSSAKVPDDMFLRAFKEITDRWRGKAVQPLEHAGPEGGPIPIASADELREQIARRLAGLTADGGADPPA